MLQSIVTQDFIALFLKYIADTLASNRLKAFDSPDAPLRYFLAACQKALNCRTIAYFKLVNRKKKTFECQFAAGDDANRWISMKSVVAAEKVVACIDIKQRRTHTTNSLANVFSGISNDENYFIVSRTVSVNGVPVGCIVLAFNKEVDGLLQVIIADRIVETVLAYQSACLLGYSPTPYSRTNELKQISITLIAALTAHDNFGFGIDAWLKILTDAVDEVQCKFQPIIDINKGLVEGHELLMRKGNTFPAATIEMARLLRIKGCLELDLAILRKAANYFTQYNEIFENSYAFINIHPSTLLHPEFVYRIKNDADLFPLQEHAVIEVIEHECDCDFAYLFRNISNELFNQRFLIALDDAEEHLVLSTQELNFDYIKLSVNRFKSEESLIEYASNLSFCKRAKMIIERIENIDQAQNIYRKLGSNNRLLYFQGWYFSKDVEIPINKDTFITKAENVRVN